MQEIGLEAESEENGEVAYNDDFKGGREGGRGG